MDIGQLILDALRSEYKNGATQTEMARRHGIPQSYMQRLLAGTRPAGGISIVARACFWILRWLCLIAR